MPHCNRTTIGPGAGPAESASIGTACHIYAAAEGGPRGTGGLTPEQRQSIENAFWACAVHGRLIDTNRGAAFPAALLLQWRKLHEERLRRDAFQTPNNAPIGWLNRLEIINSPLFRPSEFLHFSKAVLMRGGGADGKSAICDWLSGFTNRGSLARWQSDDLDVRLEYSCPEDNTALLSMKNGETRVSNNNIPSPGGLHGINVVYLQDVWHKFPRRNYRDDLEWLAGCFATQTETINDLCEDIRLNGHPIFRQIRFHKATEPEIHDEILDEGTHLYVAFGHGSRRYEVTFDGASGSEQIAVLVEFALALARLQSTRVPTLLILDIGWNWSEPFFDNYAEYLFRQPCQVLLVHNNFPSDLAKPAWAGWQGVEVIKEHGLSRIVQDHQT